MARAALKLSIADLAEMAELRPMTVSTFENGGADPRRSTMERLREELEKRGAVFIGESEASLSGGAGVRLRGG